MPRRDQAWALAALALIVVGLWIYPWLDKHRAPTGPIGGARLASTIEVTSSADAGPGTLRAALFAALRSQESTSIVISVGSIRLVSPLPPLTVDQTITIAGAGASPLIDASLPGASQVFDVRTGSVAISALVIRSSPEPGHAAIQVGGPASLVLDSVRVEGADVGLRAGGSAELVVVDSDFDSNRIGIEIVGMATATVADSRFEAQTEAGIWAVGTLVHSAETTRVTVARSTLTGAQYGIVLANAAGLLDDNEIADFALDGVFALGGSLAMSRNRIHDGAGAAIRAVGNEQIRLVANELFDNGAFGIFLKHAPAAVVEANRIHRNGYGMFVAVSAARTEPGPGVSVVNGNIVSGNVLGDIVHSDETAEQRED